MEEIKEIRNISKKQFDTLYRISRMLNSVTVRENLVEKSMDLVVDAIQAERALFVRYDDADQSFSIIAARNIQKETISDLSAFSSGILQKVIERQAPCLYHDVQSDPQISQFESVRIQNIKSVIGVPIFNEGKIWGVILADSRKNRREFSEENLRFLEFFANLVSLALEKIIYLENLQKENIALRHKLDISAPLPQMIGQSPAMKKFFSLIRKVAQTDATVLITGESGTGKELAAKAIHELSNRKDKPYLAQFCGSIPDTLLESELFGYKKGAFTGAVGDKKGLFEVADGGSFFLDEIADISVALQAKLLRVIQNQEIIPLGDTRVKKVNVRIITATNKDLRQLVREGKFREDLFYRLNVFPIHIPPLRDRAGDIPLLANSFIKKFAARAVRFDPQALKKMESYSWPGNVRQLENTVQRALILCDGNRILPEHIILDEEESPERFEGTLRDFEKLLLLKRLQKFGGNRTLTAKSLGVSVRWIQLKLKEIERERENTA
ncbi:MAG: GAF domain-containing protein [Calditrichaeota bacterium]|nr:GAF domain-containing protein [Calditrichota bacterium]